MFEHCKIKKGAPAPHPPMLHLYPLPIGDVSDMQRKNATTKFNVTCTIDYSLFEDKQHDKVKTSSC